MTGRAIRWQRIRQAKKDCSAQYVGPTACASAVCNPQSAIERSDCLRSDPRSEKTRLLRGEHSLQLGSSRNAWEGRVARNFGLKLPEAKMLIAWTSPERVARIEYELFAAAVIRV